MADVILINGRRGRNAERAGDTLEAHADADAPEGLRDWKLPTRDHSV
ncbi:MAG TPA: hypothetical protein VF169_07525 [Albitalea sp.]